MLLRVATRWAPWPHRLLSLCGRRVRIVPVVAGQGRSQGGPRDPATAMEERWVLMVPPAPIPSINIDIGPRGSPTADLAI